MPEDAAPHEGQILRGSLFSEPMRVETVRAGGDGTWVLGLKDLLGAKVEVVSEDGLYWLLRRRILKEARPL